MFHSCSSHFRGEKVFSSPILFPPPLSPSLYLYPYFCTNGKGMQASPPACSPSPPRYDSGRRQEPSLHWTHSPQFCPCRPRRKQLPLGGLIHAIRTRLPPSPHRRPLHCHPISDPVSARYRAPIPKQTRPHPNLGQSTASVIQWEPRLRPGQTPAGSPAGKTELDPPSPHIPSRQPASVIFRACRPAVHHT